MDFETRLKYLDVMYQAKELTYQLETGRRVDYYSLMYVELKVLLQKALLKDPNKEENVEVFLNNLDVLDENVQQDIKDGKEICSKCLPYYELKDNKCNII